MTVTPLDFVKCTMQNIFSMFIGGPVGRKQRTIFFRLPSLPWWWAVNPQTKVNRNANRVKHKRDEVKVPIYILKLGMLSMVISLPQLRFMAGDFFLKMFLNQYFLALPLMHLFQKFASGLFGGWFFAFHLFSLSSCI